LKAAELVLPRQFAFSFVDEQCITFRAPRDDRVGIPGSRHSFVLTHCGKIMVLDIQSDKVLTANRGFLSARHLQDIRKVARIARSEGISLTVHGVVVGGQEILHLQKHESSTGTNFTAKKHDGCGSPPTETVGDACEKPTAKQQRSARRLEQYKAAKRADVCNARWLRLATPLLRRTRAKLRGDVWTAHMRAKLALRAKMGALFHRVWSQRALVVQPDAEVMAPWPSTPQLSEKKAAATPAAAMCATSTAAMCATPACISA
jgi:hypothetical protein